MSQKIRKPFRPRTRQRDPRGFDPRPLRQNGEELGLSGPFGWRLTARGPVVIVIILVLAIVGASGYFWWRAERTVKDVMAGHEERGADRRARYLQDHEAIVKGIKEMVDQGKVQTYILSLPESRRKELGLDEPEELRRWRFERDRRPR